ncbi:ferredoxin [Hypericibacter adhaerens]|uniref:Ferredoxin n=1 Tax=Hypericibacter adhaerens TaxID=2602016 RepID=A0A5J6NBC5_9PROT|nr:heterodisulfide reductase-related iron-sulfur binding cluster [Hypericibacter adhaerens]QEX25316.1 ferredoxin [Hypericibacter adhaerens]
MREGSLEPPVRHPLDWNDPDFTNWEKLDAEMRRVFDICHGCRRCFNLCDSFPRLFDLVDASPDEMHGVKSEDFKQVVDACTLCDLCFMTKCPYVPPHEFNLDFPHLMLRYRAAERARGHVEPIRDELGKTDRNGRLGAVASPVMNWAVSEKNGLTRPLMEKVAGVDRHAALPKFHSKTFMLKARQETPEINREAPGFGRKAVLYATCFVNYHNPGIGEAARKVLARNGVETEVLYPACCGMPQLEAGNISKVAEGARKVSEALLPWVEKGYDVIALVPSCALMLKFEWPLILPADAGIKKLSQATFDITEYVVDIAKRNGIAPGLKPLEGGVALHIACHSRAQNMGQKAAEMLRLIPQADLAVIERCSGHGGSWGVMEGNFETALKVGKPVARQAQNAGKAHLASECPLAGAHIVQGMERIADGQAAATQSRHPIELLAQAYGL